MSTSSGVVVTGASTGIGRACALDLVRRGFVVFAGVRQPAAGESLAEEGGERLVPVQLDITLDTQIRHAVERVAEVLGDRPLLGLVNNAGITVNSPLEFLPDEEMRRQLEVNVVRQMSVTRAFLPRLRRDRGRIVLMGSVTGLAAMPGLGAYSMSKSALHAMADVLRLELSPWRIAVSLIQPGTIETPIWQKGIDDWEAFSASAPDQMHELYGAQIRAVRGMVDFARRQATGPQVVADAVAHALTSPRPKARYMVGGGVRRQWLMSKLPVTWRDRLLRKLMRL